MKRRIGSGRFDHIEEVAKNNGNVDQFDQLVEIGKFNPYHDAKGRFSTSSGYASFTFRTKDPSKQHMADMAVAREKERSGAASGAQRVKEAETAIRGMLGEKTTVILEGVDPDMAESIKDSVALVLDRYPSTRDAFGGFTTYDTMDGCFRENPGVMACYSVGSRMIHLNTSYFGDRASFEQKYAESVARKSMPAGTTAHSVVVHEMGHAIDWYVSYATMDAYKVRWDVDRASIRMWNNDIRAGRRKGTPMTGASIRDGLSRYAGSKPSEYLAEGFSEYLTSPNPRPMARSIGRRVETYIRKAERAGDD